MSITDELRREARGFSRYVYTAPQAEHLTAIADRIDVEHEKQLTDARADGIQQGIEVDMIARNDHGWVKLPVDADGVPIRLGDDMETLLVGHEGEHAEVVYMALTEDGWEVDGEPPKTMRHYHKPTVEDVLREMLYKAHIYDEREMELLPDLIAEYAAKLRLAGEDDD